MLTAVDGDIRGLAEYGQSECADGSLVAYIHGALLVPEL
jgi:hypothetical protein